MRVVRELSALHGEIEAARAGGAVRRSATRRCSASATSRPAGTSRCRSWPTGTARCGRSASASARSSVGTRRWSRRRRRRSSSASPGMREKLFDAARLAAERHRLRGRRHRRIPRRRTGRLLLPGDEHPPAGGAPGHRVHHRARPRRAAAAGRVGGCRLPAEPPATARALDRGPAVRRGSRPRTGNRRAAPSTTSRFRGAAEFEVLDRTGVRLDSGRRAAASSECTTTRCWPRSSRSRRHPAGGRASLSPRWPAPGSTVCAPTATCS